MNKVVLVHLDGSSNPYSLEESAYDSLNRYLERAQARLADDPDKMDVLRDLEQSIGEKFANLLRTGQRMLTRGDVEAVLAQMGAVNTGTPEPPAYANLQPPSRRRLYRLREGQKIAGVCTGLAAYADVDLTIVRVLMIVLTAFTGGVFALVYIVMMFVVPVANMPEEQAAAHGGRMKAQ